MKLCTLFFDRQAQALHIAASSKEVAKLMEEHDDRRHNSDVPCFWLLELPVPEGGSAFIDPDKVVLIIDMNTPSGLKVLS